LQKTSFWGGVHPVYNKHFTAAKAVAIIEPPSELILPLQQHTGEPARADVKKGDEVLAGQRIASAQGTVSAHVHAPVSGTVTAVEPRPHTSGEPGMSIVLENDFKDDWVEMTKVSDPVQLSAEDIKECIENAGIVGMGGAGFPTSVKLSPPEADIDYLIVNGSECEPYLSSDHRTMVEYAEDVVLGTKLLAKACGAQRIIIGVEDNKPDALQALQEHSGGLDVVVLDTKYPQGGEKQMIKSLTGREVPSNGLPHQCGVIVQNVGTAAAAAQAVRDGRPLTHRIVTVSGEGVQSPNNFLVPIGTPFQHVIDAAGGLIGDTGKIIDGGPMTGAAQITAEVPVIKGTCGIVVLTREQSLFAEPIVCIKCARCADSCPTYLLPMRIERAAIHGMWDEASELGAMDCIECGCCTFICPSKRYLLHYIRLAKNQIAAARR